MSKRYALRLTEGANRLARYLNGNEEMPVDDESYFIFTVTDNDAIEAEAILIEDAIYDEKGHLVDDLEIV